MDGPVLLTGASGLLGRATLAALADAGAEVIAASRSGTPLPGAALSLAADLTDAAGRARLLARAVGEAGAQTLIHLAWFSGPGRMAAAANLDWAAATIALMRGFAGAGGRRAVAAGSCAEYDWADAAGVFAEDAPLRPRSLYGAAKARTGQLLCTAAPALGISLAWARIFFTYGPDEPEGRLLGDLAAGIRAGRAVACSDGAQRRDFLPAEEVGRALAHLAGHHIAGPVNVASGTAIPVRDLIETAARLMGRPDLIRLGARARAPGDPPCIAADIARLRATGFAPRLSLETGLARALGLAAAGTAEASS